MVRGVWHSHWHAVNEVLRQPCGPMTWHKQHVAAVSRATLNPRHAPKWIPPASAMPPASHTGGEEQDVGGQVGARDVDQAAQVVLVLAAEAWVKRCKTDRELMGQGGG